MPASKKGAKGWYSLEDLYALDADIRTDIEDGACCDEAFCDVARLA